jgi:hypothetical protein
MVRIVEADMDDIETRLRDALQSAIRLPPPGLIDRVRRRHRRHLKRVAAGWVASAAAVAIVVPPAVHALVVASNGPGSRPGGVATNGPGSPSRSPQPKAAAGTVLSGCDSANPGAIGTSWRSGAVRLGASPLWIIDGGHGVGRTSSSSGHQRLELGVGVMVVTGLAPGSTVVVRVTPAGRPYLRFLYGPADSLNPGTRYTMASGESGVTFVSCPAGGFAPSSNGTTNYYGGFLTPGIRCVPVDIWWTGHQTPVRVNFGTC